MSTGTDGPRRRLPLAQQEVHIAVLGWVAAAGRADGQRAVARPGDRRAGALGVVALPGLTLLGAQTDLGDRVARVGAAPVGHGPGAVRRRLAVRRPVLTEDVLARALVARRLTVARRAADLSIASRQRARRHQ